MDAGSGEPQACEAACMDMDMGMDMGIIRGDETCCGISAKFGTCCGYWSVSVFMYGFISQGLVGRSVLIICIGDGEISF
jgi:hypothetical protein